MKIVNKHDIKLFVASFAGRDEALGNLLHLGLSGPLQHDYRGLDQVRRSEDLPNDTLRKRFLSQTTPWYYFKPSEEQVKDVKKICCWLMDFVSQAGKHYNGFLRDAAERKMRDVSSVQTLVNMTKTPFMNENEFQTAFRTRLVGADERFGDIQHISALSERHQLFEIVSTQGMKIAGRKARNCLKSTQHPDPAFPHKERVNYPEYWRYFTIRDADNNSVITIMIDFYSRRVEFERNDTRNLTSLENRLWAESREKLESEYPDLFGHNAAIGYCGTFDP